MRRFFLTFVLAGFVAMLLMAGLYALAGVTRPPLTGGIGWALLDVTLYSALTGGVWWLLSRWLERARAGSGR